MPFGSGFDRRELKGRTGEEEAGCTRVSRG